MNSLLRPSRVDAPAASTTPATPPARSDRMDRLQLLAEVAPAPAPVDGEEFGHDTDRDLLRSVGAHIETDRTKHLRSRYPELRHDFIPAPPRPEQADVAGSSCFNQGA